MFPVKLRSHALCSSKRLSLCCCQFLINFSSKPSSNWSPASMDIFSELNKLRVQKKIKLVEPVRSTKDLPLKDNFNTAAVLVPLCTVNGEPSLLLTLRSTKLSSYSGQVSFPGGHVDEGDLNLAFTALRETQEELGIHPSAFEVWGEMNPLPSSNRATIAHPILAKTGEIDVSQLMINTEEVEEAFTVTLEHLCHLDNIRSTRFRIDPSTSYTLPVYTGATHRIWGLTAVIVHQLLSLIAPKLYTFKLRHKETYRAL